MQAEFTVIAHYGDGLPAFIESFAPLADVPYLADVARIEAAWTNAYHAADAAPATLESIASLPPETLPGMRLTPHVSASLVSFSPSGRIDLGRATRSNPSCR